VIPRLTTAHNFSSPRNLGAYRFLCALQSQGVDSLHFSWGALEAASFLPRVRIGRTIVSLARWRLSSEALAGLKHDDCEKQFAALQSLRSRHRWPRWVAVADGDNLLPVDLDNILSVETFVQLAKDRPQVTLTELFGADGLCVQGPEGGFMHELVLPLMTVPPAAAARAVSPPRSRAASGARRFPPGSEWLYAKLYTGTATGDEVLRDCVAPLISKTIAVGAADSWFFIRYADPEPHVRLRLHGDPDRLTREVLPLVQTAGLEAVARGISWRVQLDTYEREVERYGGDEGIVLSEQLFCADSDAVLGIVETLSGDAAADVRWRLALRGMDQLLDDVGLTLDEKLAVVKGCRLGFGKEHKADGLLDHQMGARFRRERLALEALIDRRNDMGSELEPGLMLLQRRSERIATIAQAWRRCAEAGRLAAPLDEVAASWLHMHANRMLRGAARAQELVIYDFLTRLYEGQRARQRGRNSSRQQ
jgi:thiopeptide-type bacteriocin biosynthesis protein